MRTLYANTTNDILYKCLEHLQSLVSEVAGVGGGGVPGTTSAGILRDDCISLFTIYDNFKETLSKLCQYLL